jgi:DNA-binding LacI/PurR family transcriptional regulator
VDELIIGHSPARVSVTQIAARAGVSIATVSRVLNNTRRVNPDIAEQVRKAMTDLRYSPRLPRKKNRANETDRKRIAIVSLGGPYRDWFDMPVMASVVAEITRAAQADHLGVLMTEMPDPQRLSPILRQREIDGALVFIHSPLDASAARVLAQHLPVVRVMGGQLAPVDIDHVAPDNVAVGYLAASYLVSRGCQTMAYLTTQPSWDLNKLRAQGFAAAGQRAGVATQAYVVASDSTDHLAQICGPEARARPTLAELMDDLCAQRPAGLFVSRDEELVQVYRLLAERGCEPGKDIRIISCDNENVRLSMLEPRPASIEIGTAELALRAVRRLEGRIKHPAEPPVRILVTPRLVLPN